MVAGLGFVGLVSASMTQGFPAPVAFGCKLGQAGDNAVEVYCLLGL